MSLRRFWMGFLFINLTNCSTGIPDPQPLVFVEQILVEVDPLTNLDTAIALDFVVVYDDALASNLLKLSASAYFTQKKQLIRDNPMGMDIYSWELVPGQVINPTPIKMTQPIPRAGIFYANYLTPGDHRVKIGSETGVKVILGKQDLAINAYQFKE